MKMCSERTKLRTAESYNFKKIKFSNNISFPHKPYMYVYANNNILDKCMYMIVYTCNCNKKF